MSLSEVSCTVVHYLVVHVSELSLCMTSVWEYLVDSVLVVCTYTVLRYGLRVCSQVNIMLGCCCGLCAVVVDCAFEFT
jgi:hypothetical protein